MSSLSFGQPEGSIVQTAYVVPNLRAAIDQWVGDLAVGPWFVAEHFKGLDPRYRGKPTSLDASIAMAFAGHMCIELIEQHDEQPSVFKDIVSTRGFGFHHWGIGTRAFDRLHAKHEDAGYETVFTDQVPGGGRIAYHDTARTLPGMIELIEMTDAVEALFHRFHQASVDWDRRDPVRPMF